MHAGSQAEEYKEYLFVNELMEAAIAARNEFTEAEDGDADE